MQLQGQEPGAVLDALRAMGRDNARTPMQWTAEPGAGFTSATPWIGVNPNHDRVNAATQTHDPRSVFAYYRRVIALRHEDPVVVHGDFRMLLPEDPALFAYERVLTGTRLLVVANLSDDAAPCGLGGDELVLTNLPEAAASTGVLEPWEARIYRSTDA